MRDECIYFFSPLSLLMGIGGKGREKIEGGREGKREKRLREGGGMMDWREGKKEKSVCLLDGGKAERKEGREFLRGRDEGGRKGGREC